MSNKLSVEIVSPERELWAGEGDMVIAKTADGEIGIQPGHVPVLGTLSPGAVVRVIGARETGEVRAAAHGGFVSVAQDRVSILAETAELSEDIDVQRAKTALRESESGSADESEESRENAERAERARSRLRAVGEDV
ncbi:F0F1 ATP synthase subunit epsilon [Halostreptopolyspora alba]|uniref:ATP synthase epsilon chain n=1 Tax=Halostreptopolyspora alba TaxID=2487137 RepID=A0A3N0E9P4_9ACTN|nr:F0F1 ATP synthase subunit epsilon [Nocardiopsaceae bacterium YIM 96095]